MVRNREKPYSQKWENLLQIRSHFNIISGKTGKIFYNNTLHLLISCQFQNLLYSRSFHTGTGITIIIKLLKRQFSQLRNMRNIIFHKFSLVDDTVTFSVRAILQRKTIISDQHFLITHVLSPP